VWLAQADRQVKLPMYGQVNSLNVAVAAALLLYEVVRQRDQATCGCASLPVPDELRNQLKGVSYEAFKHKQQG
jgi:tRNA C32,U32 (ribose-2'-O)-methylase TrmJ